MQYKKLLLLSVLFLGIFLLYEQYNNWQQNKEITIKLELVNNYNETFEFLNCEIEGELATDVDQYIYPGTTQSYIIKSTDPLLLHGKCFYIVPTYYESTILEFFFHYDKRRGQEWYGIVNSEYYDTNVILFDTLNAKYYVSQYDYTNWIY